MLFKRNKKNKIIAEISDFKGVIIQEMFDNHENKNEKTADKMNNKLQNKLDRIEKINKIVRKL